MQKKKAVEMLMQRQFEKNLKAKEKSNLEATERVTRELL